MSSILLLNDPRYAKMESQFEVLKIAHFVIMRQNAANLESERIWERL